MIASAVAANFLSSDERNEFLLVMSIHICQNNRVASILQDVWNNSFEPREHGERMAELSWLMGRKMRLADDRVLDLIMLALLHDIGKMIISKKILNKPGPLDMTEITEVKNHSLYGERIARLNPDIRHLADGILSHHERWDGNGYPYGLSGKIIPLTARVIAVVDAFDVMIHDWPYRKAISVSSAAEELISNAGTQFDPYITQIFVEQILNSPCNRHHKHSQYRSSTGLPFCAK
jgi:HD-GYP domain-containing protein (c-di-GMP phosphodiesterase class II)